MEITFEQARLVFVVYNSAIIPLILIPYLYFKNSIPEWVPLVYFAMFIICALGWEIWFTYGFVEGDNVDSRRSDVLSQLIPMHVNWLMNSLADAGTICMGGLFITWSLMKRDSAMFHIWKWKCFFILLMICISQNILVEMYLYHHQLSIGKSLSWAPFSPLGSWFNPVLVTLDDRTIFLQSQIPWIFMVPTFYGLLVCYNKIKQK